MSRRARIRERQDMKRRPIPDSPSLEEALAALAADRQRREQQQPQQKG